MKIKTKYLPAGLLFFCLFSCHDKTVQKDIRKTNEVQDSSLPGNNVGPANPYVLVDVSPMDMSYFPTDYPILKMTGSINGLPLARVIYSRPHLQGRELFHDVLKYGEPWRLGANEATEFQLYHAATIEKKKLAPGRYVLYCIPLPDQWTIILNSNIDSWGLKPDSTKDIARFVVPVNSTSRHLEYFTMIFQKTNSGADLLMAWDNLEAKLPIVFPKE